MISQRYFLNKSIYVDFSKNKPNCEALLKITVQNGTLFLKLSHSRGRATQSTQSTQQVRIGLLFTRKQVNFEKLKKVGHRSEKISCLTNNSYFLAIVKSRQFLGLWHFLDYGLQLFWRLSATALRKSYCALPTILKRRSKHFFVPKKNGLFCCSSNM